MKRDRHCGDCQLCCKLLPVRELGKGANSRCQHQKRGKGCGVYHTKAMPISCKLWNCRWLLEDKTESLRRPDRSGYVIDVMPDFVTHRNEISGEETNLPVLQVWVDPKSPNAWRGDRDFMAYLARLGREEGLYALIRNGSIYAVFIAPPALNDGEWFVHDSGVVGPQHTVADIARAGFNMTMKLEGEL